MSKLVTLDEVDEYERELRRAHAENRAPALRNPHDVHAENLGNAETHLVERAASEVKSETDKLHSEQKKAKREDKRLRGVIRDNAQRVVPGEGTTGPYQAPDPKRFDAPKTTAEKEYADRQSDHLVAYGQSFDDSFSDVNIPNTDDDGHVLGDSVNRVFTRKMMTSSEDELVRQDERNSVPVPERYKLQNPPQVVQQSNPITLEPPTPEPGEEYPEDYDAIPHTAIKFPYPEHVIGDETGTTREVSRTSENDQAKATNTDPSPAKTVPVSDRQVFQGAVKRPGDPVHSLGAPADAPPANRPVDNKAKEVAQKVVDEERAELLKDDLTREKNLQKETQQVSEEQERLNDESRDITLRSSKSAAAKRTTKKTAAKKTTAKKTTAKKATAKKAAAKTTTPNQ